MSMQVPEVSPVQLVQKYETGTHWKIIAKVFEIPKQIEVTPRTYAMYLYLEGGNIRR